MDERFFMIIPFVAGFILDLLIGDPYRLWHPIRLFGSIISYLEKILNKGKNRILKGGLMTISLISSVYLVFAYAFNYMRGNHSHVFLILASIFAFYGLANRSLIQEALKVEKALNKGGVEAGRKQLSYIVGRDTSQLDANQIRTAVLETLSENLSDGVIAPMIFYLVGGVPLMFTYKMINTLDSMIGYKNERYLQFGRVAAKIDDFANYLPARITAFLMVLVTFSWRGLQFIGKYHKCHSSPNAAWPEAALAGILDCRFGGPNIYHGKIVEKPYIGSNSREITPKDIRKAVYINLGVSIFLFLLVIIPTSFQLLNL